MIYIPIMFCPLTEQIRADLDEAAKKKSRIQEFEKMDPEISKTKNGCIIMQTNFNSNEKKVIIV